MKVILCTGDSHTWGQGASGLVEYFGTYRQNLMAGDLRAAPFLYPSYVNLTRRAINAQTGSYAGEYGREQYDSFRFDGEQDFDDCLLIHSGSARLTIRGSLVRVAFQCAAGPVRAEIAVDGKRLASLDLHGEGNLDNQYRYAVLHLEADGDHELCVTAVGGTVRLYRAECYGGPYAVINCGIGSCSTRKYLDVYWQDYVVAYKPYAVIMEAQTINDWLNLTPEESYRAFLAMISGVRQLGAIPLVMTVAPIMGSQINQDGADYAAYQQTARQAAQTGGAALIDANRAMSARLAGLDEQAQFKLLFRDAWHVNDEGNRIYADLILQSFGKAW